MHWEINTSAWPELTNLGIPNANNWLTRCCQGRQQLATGTDKTSGIGTRNAASYHKKNIIHKAYQAVFPSM